MHSNSLTRNIVSVLSKSMFPSENPYANGGMCDCVPKKIPYSANKCQQSLLKCDFRRSHDNLVAHKNYQQNLCDQLDTTYLTDVQPIVRKLYGNVSDHDKKILQCMLAKRLDDTVRSEYAYVARKYWDEQKAECDELLRQENARFMKWIKEKREIDAAIGKCHTDDAKRKRQRKRATMKNECTAKKRRGTRRLEKILMERNAMNVQRMERRVQKQQLTSIALEKNRLDDEIRCRECSLVVDEKIGRADAVRKYHLDSYRRRVCAENERQQLKHTAQFEELKRLEEMKLEYLKQQMRARDRKCKQFVENKSQWIERSRSQARVTATLRDIVRKSTSPENQSYRNYVYSHIKSSNGL